MCGKIASKIGHNWAQVLADSAHGLTRTSPTWLDHPVRPFGCVPKQNVQQSTFPGPREKEERGSLRGQVERGDEGERRREREKESAR